VVQLLLGRVIGTMACAGIESGVKWLTGSHNSIYSPSCISSYEIESLVIRLTSHIIVFHASVFMDCVTSL
jgi:hypothetical protein